MKGIIDIEYLLAIAVFLTTISFVTIIIMSNVPLFHREAVSEDLRARAYQISELLLFDRGDPVNWDQVNVNRIGLSTGTRYKLSSLNIVALKELCTANYQRVKNLLGQDYRTDVLIEVTDQDDNLLARCMPASVTTVRPNFQITRFAALDNGKIAKLTVSVT